MLHPNGPRRGFRLRRLAVSPPSLVRRLARLHQLLAALLILLFAACAIAISAATLKRQESNFLDNTALQMANSIALELPEEGSFPRAAQSAFEESAPVGVRVEIFDPSGRRILASPGAPGAIRGGWRVVRVPIQGGGWLVASAPTEPRRRAVWILTLALALASVPLLLLVTAVSRSVARRALRPLSRIASQAERTSVETPLERFAVADDPVEIAVLASAFDRLLARVHESLRAERHFTRDAAHELRTPLTVVSGEIEYAMQDGSLSAPAREGLRHAREQSRAMSDLLEALLLLRRAEPGSNGNEDLRQPVNLSDLVRDLEHELRAADAARGPDLDVVTEDEVLVPGHAALLASAIRNLLSNALKFTTGGQRVRVLVLRADGRGIVVVEDAGPGIPPEDMERVFDLFFRSAEARAGREGFGLGLPILRRVARAHGGDVTLTRSNLGGARFELSLPAWSARA